MILRLLRFLLLVGIGYLIYKFVWKGEPLGFFKFKKKRRHQSPKAIEEMKKDPVCGTYIPENQAIRYRRNNTTYYFCSEECKKKFQELKE
jgi:YHS domain-containing protein